MNFFYTFFFIFIFTACQNKNQTSFINLEQAFVEWYYRYNPSISTNHGIYKNNNSYDKFSKESYSEKIGDVNRFKIELSQIDETKLNSKEKNSFISLNNVLEDISESTNIYLDVGYNFLEQLLIAYSGVFYLLNNDDIEMDDRVENLSNRLRPLSLEIGNINRSIDCINKYQIKAFNDIYDCFSLLLDDIPIKIYADNKILDEIDYYIKGVQISLNVLRDNIDRTELHKCEDSRERYVKSFLPLENSLDSLNQKLNTISNEIKDEIFNLALIEYVKFNDEPIWVDYDDSLYVINYIFSDIMNDTIPNDELLSEIYQSVTDVNNIINSQIDLRAISSIPHIDLDYNDILLSYETPFSFVDYKTSNNSTIFIFKGINKHIDNSSIRTINNSNYIQIYLFSHLLNSRLINSSVLNNNKLNRIYFDLFLIQSNIQFFKNYYINQNQFNATNRTKLLFKAESLITIYKIISILNSYNIDEIINLFISDKTISNFVNVDGVLYEINLNYKNILKEFFWYNQIQKDNNISLNDYVNNITSNVLFISKNQIAINNND